MTNPRVVIVGAGFGGLSAAKALADSAFDVTVIDQHNYHLFQPLLYQVATAGLSPADIASPIRGILARAQNVNVILGKVSAIDTDRREVLADGRRVPVRHADPRDRRAARLFRPRRMGRERAGTEDHRRRDLHPPPHPARLREGRNRNRPGRAGAAAEFRDRRRRADRRRDGGRDRRAGEPRPREGLPLHRPARRTHHSGRGRAAPADAVRSAALGSRAHLARTARRGGTHRRGSDRARRCGRVDRRRAYRGAHRHMGRRRDGLARRPMARRRDRPRGPREGRARPFGARDCRMSSSSATLPR